MDRAFRDADRESYSIFHSVLDAILIVNSKGECLDANAAAASMLCVPLNKLIGRNIASFFSDREQFEQRWAELLRLKRRRNQVELLTADGKPLFVDFAATPNYLPGRHVLILCDVTERTRGEIALRKSEVRFRHMADNIQEVFWMMDAATQEIAYVNPAYSTLTGHSVEALYKNPSSYRELIHPEDRARVLSKLQGTLEGSTIDEEFRFVRADDQVRWAWAKGIAASEHGENRWIIGTAQDITARKQAEIKINQQLEAVEAARAEAEALRKATLALSQNLAMDAVLDTLLNCIHELVPFDKAAVLFVEDGAELLVAREAPRSLPPGTGATFPASACPHLEPILFERKCFLLQDLSKDDDLKKIKPFSQFRSWIGVPLIAAGQVLGILSLGQDSPHAYTPEHLRFAKSLAVPAAVAIQNARIHERAEIYAAELELRLKVGRVDPQCGN